MFNLAGAFAYLIVAAIALAALRGARADVARQWLLVALAFVALAAWRLGQGEALVHDGMRALAEAGGAYAQRRAAQAPVVAFAVVAGGGAWLYVAMTGGLPRWLHRARLATLALLGYTVVRAISFHPVDAIIYAGPGLLHVNHLIDMGLSAIVAGCAVADWRSTARARAKSGLND